MFKYNCLNPIASVGLDLFSNDYEKVEDLGQADAALVRSAAMHDLELPDCLLAVARAGAGVNNIPLDKCAEKGIVVFNTPGANANGVKAVSYTHLDVYKRQEYPYIQPPMGEDRHEIPLRIMSAPEPLSEDEFQSVRTELYESVYHYVCEE